MLVAATASARSMRRSGCIERLNGHIDYLRKCIKHLDDDIDRTIRGSELWWEKAEDSDQRARREASSVRRVVSAFAGTRSTQSCSAAKLVSPLCATSVCSSKVQLSMACRRTTSTIWRVSIWRQTSARPSIDCRVSIHSSTASKRNIFSADLKVENAGRKASLLWANFSEIKVKQDREFESPLLRHRVPILENTWLESQNSPRQRALLHVCGGGENHLPAGEAQFAAKISVGK